MQSKKQSKTSKLQVLIFSITILLILLMRIFVLDYTVVSGNSMLPALNNREIIITEKISALTDSFSAGDIVVAEYPDGLQCVKRIIGRQGDIISIKSGVLTVNSKEIKELYASTMSADLMPLTVPANSYFVMGDNRDYSIDSRDENVGCISVENIKGRAVFVVFPFDKVRGLI